MSCRNITDVALPWPPLAMATRSTWCRANWQAWLSARPILARSSALHVRQRSLLSAIPRGWRDLQPWFRAGQQSLRPCLNQRDAAGCNGDIAQPGRHTPTPCPVAARAATVSVSPIKAPSVMPGRAAKAAPPKRPQAWPHRSSHPMSSPQPLSRVASPSILRDRRASQIGAMTTKTARR